MRRQPGRPGGYPPGARSRAGRLTKSLLTGRRATTGAQATTGSRATTGARATTGRSRPAPRAGSRRRLTLSLMAMGGLLAAGCGPSAPPAFRPAGVATPDRAATADRTAAAAGQPNRAAGALERPPFGGNVRIVMPGWLPADPGEVPAVIAAKDFLLAFLYAEYRGNQDDRWTAFVSGQVLGALKANLSAPSVTTESFTGTIVFSHLRAYPDPAAAGAIDVSECFDNSRSRNTDLATGKILADRVPADQHYYMNTDVMAKANGRWRVISVYPVVYYPRAAECRP
ncbi:MAG TPA: hypothetical protein VF933_30645 [Streptosporangiaceae bacterium]